MCMCGETQCMRRVRDLTLFDRGGQNHNDRTTHWEPPDSAKAGYSRPPPPPSGEVCLLARVCKSQQKPLACLCGRIGPESERKHAWRSYTWFVRLQTIIELASPTSTFGASSLNFQSLQP